jgi:Rne/Rng family ribonuclease
MAKEICISSTPHETRLAILEDDQLAEIYYERENEYTLAGSIYNGRVTRVLPGMQSAFVDLGLERDAFLYVTDFIELEDQEDADELEKAAARGAGQAPREVKHPQGVDQNGGRQEERGPRRDQGRQEPRQQEPRIDHRTAEEAHAESTESPAPAAQNQSGIAEESDEAGSRRFRGRHRRRGGRGSGDQRSTPAEFERGSGRSAEAPAAPASVLGTASASEKGAAIHSSEASPAPRGQHAPAAFVMPGESLSRYGGTPAPDAQPTAPQPVAPPRPASTFKPASLVEAPLSWDGSGLLPGESLSLRRRGAEAPVETNPIEASARDTDHEAPNEAAAAPDAQFAHEEMIEEIEESDQLPSETETAAREEAEDEFEEDELEDDEFDEETNVAGDDAEESDDPGVDGFESSEDEPTASGETALETEEDADASHRVDPSAPSGFKLFGFGKKKKDAEAEAASKTAVAAPVSTYAPGNGVVEEELIEGEEFDAAPHARRHKPEVHDGDDYEEETLPSNMRTGDLGEMLQEAHLDHRIQMNFDEKGVEEDEAEEGEGASTGTQPAPGRGGRDRGRPGQRGRGAPNNRRGPSRRSAQTTDLPIISDLLKSGQEILVQIAKEPIAKKGARITSHIALPGRFLVFMPTVTHVGVSRKIASEEERHRLKRILIHERGESTGGLIVRTAAEGASEEELRADLRFLMNLWNDIKQRSESSKSPALIYHDLSLIERILRDQVSSNFANIWVDTEADYERIVRFLNRFSPSLVRRVKLYTKETPLFEHFGIQDEISKALRSKVWLKSGGSIVINQTEALVAIDINTGKYVGKSARLEDTILKTNLDAVPEIVRQIRLRDLGGIIVIDFIDMDERRNRFKVMAALEEALKNDRAPTKVLQFNDFGLVAITRKRVKQSLERTLSVPCPVCQATGMVKSSATVCNEIYIEMRKMRKHFENADVMLRVNPETVKVLKANNNRWLTDLEELVGKNVLVKSDPTLHPEQFDIQG